MGALLPDELLLAFARAGGIGSLQGRKGAESGQARIALANGLEARWLQTDDGINDDGADGGAMAISRLAAVTNDDTSSLNLLGSQT